MDLNLIKQHIADNPYDRIPKELKEKIIEDGFPFTDVHTHVFNYQDVPDKYLGMRLPFTPRFFKKVSNILHKLVPRRDTDALSRTAYFISVFDDKSMEEIYTNMKRYYEPETLYAILMMDMRVGIKGKQERDLKGQMEVVADLRDSNQLNFLPFISIDPRREDALEYFNDAFDKNGKFKFFGLKVYPSIGYLPSHPRLMQMFEICQAKNIPVLAHCSGATVHSSEKHIKNIEGVKFRSNGTRYEEPDNKWFLFKNAYARYFNHPRNWGPVLEAFPKLKLNLAHFGGPDQWKAFLKDKPDSWVPRIIDYLYQYENLYVDFAYTMYKDEYTIRLRQIMEDNERLRKRVLFGSDYYMIVREGHYRDLFADFRTKIGDELMHQMSVTNTRNYLFD